MTTVAVRSHRSHVVCCIHPLSFTSRPSQYPYLVRQNGSAGFTLHEYLTGESTATQWCGSPVATSKRQRQLEAPTEPTGENGRPRGFLLFGTASSWNGFRHGASDCQLFQMEPMKLLSYVEKARGRGEVCRFSFPIQCAFCLFCQNIPSFCRKRADKNREQMIVASSAP